MTATRISLAARHAGRCIHVSTHPVAQWAKGVPGLTSTELDTKEYPPLLKLSKVRESNYPSLCLIRRAQAPEELANVPAPQGLQAVAPAGCEQQAMRGIRHTHEIYACVGLPKSHCASPSNNHCHICCEHARFRCGHAMAVSARMVSWMETGGKCNHQCLGGSQEIAHYLS